MVMGALLEGLRAAERVTANQPNMGRTQDTRSVHPTKRARLLRRTPSHKGLEGMVTGFAVKVVEDHEIPKVESITSKLSR